MSYRARPPHLKGEAVKAVKLSAFASGVYFWLYSLCTLWFELPFLGLKLFQKEPGYEKSAVEHKSAIVTGDPEFKKVKHLAEIVWV